jgi:hypothetical protein
MLIDDEFDYRSYRVHCSANTTSNRRFAVSLVITRVTPERLTERHFPHVASFATKREAFEHGRQVGMAWIDAQEQQVALTTPLPLIAPAMRAHVS